MVTPDNRCTIFAIGDHVRLVSDAIAFDHISDCMLRTAPADSHPEQHTHIVQDA